MGESKRKRSAAPRDKGAGGEPSKRVRPRTGSPRLTKRTIAWFLGGCLLLDIMLWAVFHFGLGKCFGVLCLL